MFYEVIKPRVGETDALGHINNTVFPQWFEAARNPIFKLFNPDQSLNLTQWNLTLANMNIDFHAPLKFGNDVEIKTYIKRIGNTSLDIYQEAWQNNVKHVSGTAVMVHYNYKEKKPQPITNEFKQKLHIHFIQTF
ncbi:acyl-CoA thioesterase [Thalassotalea atypica]|uniref:acyl-CoA thioesterase n=1 Tax=Thalassotalea atypica TaxID=2054316 RepID=UPI00257338BA|nr:thioesterase family protein [Thalassotalea atypica]